MSVIAPETRAELMPGFAIHYVANSRAGNAVILGDFPMQLTAGNTPPNFACGGGVEFLRRQDAASFGFHVTLVVEISPKEEVVRTDATGVVASVEHVQPFGDVSRMDGVRNPMRHSWDMSDVQPSVSLAVAKGCPSPTAITLVDVRPETFDYTGGDRIGAHSVVQSLGAMPPAVSAARGFSMSRLYHMGAN